MGLSLWLVPPRDVATKLRTIMKTKTSTSKSPSSFPHFEPHVTLATVPSSTPLDDLRAAIPLGQPVVPVTFRSVDVGSKYFMSVYVTVHHTGELNTLRDNLKTSLGEQAVPPLAHVSLFYIDDSDAEERTKVEEQLERDGRIVRIADDRTALNCAEDPAESSKDDLLDGFDGGEIWIALCDGPVPTWTVKDRIKLPL
ncbi:cyclic phosphodiesterase-like protein [Phanerochaete sordida]|uniref:Cyclic phosphodiesterase-like protein n=1 Tax=Phanerochaete sordida TaxID=48140 RepID=A0A9P3GKH8_9APHY|nr:cyclic phosphodiesterase-like protein [Phanerochaete sordida]